MSAHKSGLFRILSASVAAWGRIGITIVTQIALVPLYLSSWESDEFGAWLLLQSTWAVINKVDIGHHEYVGYECLRLGTASRVAIARIVFSAAPIALLIALWDLLLVWLIGESDFMDKWLNFDTKLAAEWKAALLLQAGTWLVTGSLGGLIVRGLAPFGYYPRIAWWGTAYAFITATIPGVVVFYGADLWHTAIALSASSIALYAANFADMSRIAKREGFFLVRPILKQGIKQGVYSLWLTLKGMAELVRQQGTRIVLAPLAGVADMAAFSTMRTGANFALQGLNTVTGPIMPELMRFLVARDQFRAESSFAVVWLVLCFGLSPFVLMVQYFVPLLFPLWTHGKIVFDPWLFGMLSVGVLIFALAQPAIAIIQGNNVLRPQLLISLLSALITVGGMFVLVPLIGIRGAALALLLAELVSLLAYLLMATRWLRENGMLWPWRAFAASSSSVVVAAAGIAVLAEFPEISLECLGVVILLEAIVSLVFWRCLPYMARQRAAGLAGRFVPRAFRNMIVTARGSSR